MSRTDKGKKPPGFDYWTRRIGNESKCASFGPYVKLRTHRRERREGSRVAKLSALFGFCLLFMVGCDVGFHTPPQPIKPPANDAASVIPIANREYNAGLAALYESLAVAAEGEKIKTVRDAAEMAVVEDKRLRSEYKASLGTLMQSRLGSEELPADSPAFFREMSAAFGGLRNE